MTSDNRPMEGPFAWTPDSREIIFSSARGGLSSLWRISAYGGTPRRVEGVGTRATAPAIAQVGNRLAYSSEALKVDLWKVRLTDARHAAGPAQLILPSAGFIGLASFSPDGQKLAFESSQTGYNEIWTAGSDGSNPVQLTFLKGVAGTPRWSNDGRSVAFDYRPTSTAKSIGLTCRGDRRVSFLPSPAPTMSFPVGRVTANGFTFRRTAATSPTRFGKYRTPVARRFS